MDPQLGVVLLGIMFYTNQVIAQIMYPRKSIQTNDRPDYCGSIIRCSLARYNALYQASYRKNYVSSKIHSVQQSTGSDLDLE